MSEEISLPPSELPQAQDADAAGELTETMDMPSSSDDSINEHVQQEPSTEEDKNERRVLIRKVMRYRALFQSEVEDIDLSNLGGRPLGELRDLVRDVEFLVSTRRSAKAVRSMFIGGVQVLEKGGPFFGLELHGLTSVVAQSKDLLETVDEAAVRHETMMEVDPLARIAIQMGQLILAIDSHNRQLKLSAPSQPVVPSARQDLSARQETTASTPIIKREDYDGL
jgi:hypothetical protein